MGKTNSSPLYAILSRRSSVDLQKNAFRPFPGSEITGLAHRLGYEREVIRIWFCNKRQALKNTVRTINGGPAHMANSKSHHNNTSGGYWFAAYNSYPASVNDATPIWSRQSPRPSFFGSIHSGPRPSFPFPSPLPRHRVRPEEPGHQVPVWSFVDKPGADLSTVPYGFFTIFYPPPCILRIVMLYIRTECARLLDL